MNRLDGARSNPYGTVQIRAGLIHFFIGRGIAFILVSGASLILVRFMPIKDYAVFSTLIGLQIFLVATASLGLDRVITRFIPEVRLCGDTDSLTRLIWWSLGLRLGGLCAVIMPIMILIPQISAFLNAEGYESAFEAMLVCTLLFGLSQHLMRSLQAIMEQTAVKRALLCESLSKFMIITGWVLLNNLEIGVTETVWIAAACVGLALLVQVMILRRILRSLDRSKRGWRAPYREIFRLGRNNYLQTLLLLPSEPPSLRLVGAYVLAAPAMAAYGFFQTLIGTMRRNLPIQLLLDILEPAILSRYAQTGNFRNLNSSTNSMIKINAYFILPVIGWLLVAGESMTSILTGGKYVEYSWVLIALMVALLYESHWIALRTVANAVGQYDALVKGGLWAVLGVIGMVAMLTWQPDYKLTILTLGVSGILLLQNFMAVWRMRGAGHSYTIDGIGLARLILAATIATGFSWAAKLVLSPGPLLQVLLTSVVMALIYIVIVREIKAFREDERYMFSQMSKRLEWLV